MKLVIRAPNWVGDCIMALPAIESARELSGADMLAVMARQSVAPLFTHQPGVDTVIPINDKLPRLTGLRLAARSIRQDRFDIGILFPPSLSSALIFRLGGVKGRVGFATDRRRLLLTRAVARPPGKIHRSAQYLYLIEQVTDQKGTLSEPRLVFSHEDIESGQAVLQNEGMTYDEPFVAIAPRAVAESRRWGAERYGALAKRLSEQHILRILLIGTADDVPSAEEARAFAPDRIISLCGKTGLRTAAAILSFAQLFIGNDSGLAHLAAAVNCPVVILSGPDDPEETSPSSSVKRVLIKSDLECISCIKNHCPKRGAEYMQCMKLISEDEVYAAAREIVRA